MIDIHCHILPGIDDGPSDIETSIKMLTLASNDGVTHIVATPHYTYNEKPTIEEIDELVTLLNNRIAGEGLDIKLFSGADIRLTYELIQGIGKNKIPTLNGSRYFLLELPELIPPKLDNFLFTSKMQGFVPIITHPERNYSLLSSPQKIDILREAGALFQITAMSLTGEFGFQIKSFSHMLLKKRFIDFIASDAHNLDGRIPVLSSAYRELSKLSDENEVERIFLRNPACVIEDREF